MLALVYGEKPKNRAKFSADDEARIALSKPQAFSFGAGLRFPVMIGLSEAAQKKIRFQLSAAYLFAGCALAPFFYIFFVLPKSGERGSLMTVQLGVAILAFLLLLVAGFLSWRSEAEPLALKVFESHVEIVKGQKQLASALLEHVLASPFQVLVGRRSVAYVRPQGLSKPPLALFDQALLDQTLLSRLPQKNLVSVSRLGWQQFKNQSLTVRVATAVALAFGISVQLWDAWRKLS